MLGLLSLIGRAEKHQLQFYTHFQPQPFPIGTQFYEDTAHIFTTPYLTQHIWPRFHSQLPDTLDNQPYQYWIKIPFSQITQQSRSVIALSNPHINVVKCWWFNQNGICIDSSNVTGDDFAYNQRDYLYPQYFFDFPSIETDSLYLILLIDKRNEQLLASIHFLTKSEMQSWTNAFSQLFGWLAGIIGAVFLINLFIAFQTREKIYVYYTLFLLFVAIYIVADFGWFQSLLSFDHPFKSDAFRPIAMACTAPLYTLFFLNVLEIKKLAPWLYKITHIFIVYNIIYILCTAPFFQWIMHSPIKYSILGIAYFNQIITIIFLLAMCTMGLLKKIPFSSVFLLSILIFLSTHIENFFYQRGMIPEKMIWTHFLPICYALDCMLMGGVVAQKFIQSQGKSKELLIEMQNKDRELADKITEMKESDLSRISQFLHDHVGAEISALRLHIEKLTEEESDSHQKEAWQKIAEKTGRIADDIRKTSHQLSPTMLQKFGLIHSIEHYVTDVNESGKIYVQFDHEGDCHLIQHNKSIILLQIIHELTQNTIKHSVSKNVIIQLLLHDHHKIELIVEDDGQGFDVTNTKMGLGLSQLKEVIQLTGGKFNILSAINEGTTINVELNND